MVVAWLPILISSVPVELTLTGFGLMGVDLL